MSIDIAEHCKLDCVCMSPVKWILHNLQPDYPPLRIHVLYALSEPACIELLGT